MAKKSRVREAPPAGENPRRPCPCGSGKRYKACHGAGDDVIVIRPFEGLAAECDLVAMREFLPSATAPLPLREPLPPREALPPRDSLPGGTTDRVVTLATVLPGASAALVRPDGEIMLGMQVQTRSGDLSVDLARALRWAEAAEPGTALSVVGPGVGGDPVRLQDVLDVDAALDLTLHPDFAWWVPAAEDGAEPAPDVAATLERANSVIMPTEPVVGPGVRAAYWVDTGTKAHLRWVRPEPEERLMAALARLQACGQLGLTEGARYAGAFRAHGLLVPVWDLDRELHAKEWVEPVVAFAGRLAEALADDTPLTDADRRARDALAGKQVTLR
ncbi:MAG: SEC-C domain-containing protein [Pseudonocardia sp.]|nr:SEC-C domain-containing protein [Pseudonocardia sp.]